MASHFGTLALFAFFVSVVFAALLRDEPRAQARLGLAMFGGFLSAAFVLGWVMYPLPL